MTPVAPEFHSMEGSLSTRDFARLAAHVQQHSGIRLPPSKRAFLEGRIRKRLRALGIPSFEAYCDWLFQQEGMASEETALINVITTNKTDFFREVHHFDFLRHRGLPSLVEQGRGLQAPLRLWSAGCSNGAEPYTLAMICQDFAAQTPGFQYSIQASDLSTTVLHTAARAIYPHADIEPVPMDLRKRYLLRDTQRDEIRIAPELRRKVSFSQVNLMHSDYKIRPGLDIIFCRNLIIYFDKPTQATVLGRLCAMLKPGGYLAIGHSESITGLSLPLRQVANTLFQREG